MNIKWSFSIEKEMRDWTKGKYLCLHKDTFSAVTRESLCVLKEEFGCVKALSLSQELSQSKSFKNSHTESLDKR